MQKKHLYAYGHQLLFHAQHLKESNGFIQILLCEELSLKTYTHKIFFETNQGREIYLCSPKSLDEDNNIWAFVVEECVTFFCDIKRKTICYTKAEKFSQELMEYWLIHIVLPLYFTLEGRYYFFHTGSVAIDGKAVLFMGDSYAGKSTMTDYFLKQQHPLLSDDKLATFYANESKCFMAHASHPYHRPYRAKEDLGKKTENFEQKSYEIGNIYWLEPVTAEKDIRIRELKGIKKFERLRYSTEMDVAINQKERFRYIAKFANAVSMYEVEVPHDMAKLPKVYEAIMQHIKGEE